jgi:predicted HTH transcriptional regulator
MKTRGASANKNESSGGKYHVSLERKLIDQKSLRAVNGKTADRNEIAKECIAFSNATGGRLRLGIADGRDAPPASQQIGIMNRLSNNLRPIGDRWAIRRHRPNESMACIDQGPVAMGDRGRSEHCLP